MAATTTPNLQHILGVAVAPAPPPVTNAECFRHRARAQADRAQEIPIGKEPSLACWNGEAPDTQVTCSPAPLVQARTAPGLTLHPRPPTYADLLLAAYHRRGQGPAGNHSTLFAPASKVLPPTTSLVARTEERKLVPPFLVQQTIPSSPWRHVLGLPVLPSTQCTRGHSTSILKTMMCFCSVQPPCMERKNN